MATYDNSTAESTIAEGDHELVLTAVTPKEGATLFRVHAIVNSEADEAVTYTYTSFKETDTDLVLAADPQTLAVGTAGAIMTMNGPGTVTHVPFEGSGASGVGMRISVFYTVPANTAVTAPDISYLFDWKV